MTTNDYPWPSEVLHELYLRDFRGNEEAAQAAHRKDLVILHLEREREKRMRAAGKVLSPWGSWEDPKDLWPRRRA